MATLRNKRKLAAVTRETQKENPRNGQSRNTSVPRINEEYMTQVSEDIEGRVSKKLSQELSRTESRILGALSKLEDFLLNQQIRTHSETVPGTFRNTNMENQGTNEDDSQSDPHPEVGPSVCQSRHSIDSDTGETHDMMTGVIEQTTKGPHTWSSMLIMKSAEFFLNTHVFYLRLVDNPIDMGCISSKKNVPQWHHLTKPLETLNFYRTTQKNITSAEMCQSCELHDVWDPFRTPQTAASFPRVFVDKNIH